MNDTERNSIIGFLIQEGPPCTEHYSLPESDVITKYAEWPNDRHCIGWRYYWDTLSKATAEELINILFDTIRFWERQFWDQYNKSEKED